MGRRGALAVGSRRTKGASLGLGGGYFPAPPDIAPESAPIWDSVVSSLPENHFRTADIPQLRAYCDAAAKHVLAGERVRELGAVLVKKNDGVFYESPWSKIQDKCAQTMASLATKLRITQSSMLSAKGARREWDTAGAAEDADDFSDLVSN